jgi:hypothetical protein
VIILGLYFSIENSVQKVSIEFWKYRLTDVPMVLALFVSFILGVTAWFLYSIIQILQIKTEVRGLRRKNQHLSKELADLRNMSIEEFVPDDREEDSDSDQ